MEQQGLNFLVKDNVPRFEWEKKVVVFLIKKKKRNVEKSFASRLVMMKFVLH